MSKSHPVVFYLLTVLFLTTVITAPGTAMIKSTEFIVVEDTIKLATDVYLPDDPGQYPCILYRTPYGKDNIKKEPEQFVEKGYAVVCQDNRGKFNSDGKFYAFRDDRPDGLATINWIKKQSWYNGKICGWGGSYLGYTQWAISDQLDVMTPIFTTANMYDALYTDGLFSLGLAFRWGLIVDSKLVNNISAEKMEKSYSILPLSLADDSTFQSNQFTDDWLFHSYPDAYWVKMDHRAPVSIPVFSVAGWYDIFLMPQINDFEALEAVRHPDSYLVIGPWAHGSFAAKIEYGEQANYGKVIAPIMHRFTAKHMLNEPQEIIQKPFEDKTYLLFIMQRNEWYTADHWPPKAVTPTNYYMGSDETLSTSCPEQKEKAGWKYDPADPYPSLGGTIIGKDVGAAWQNDNLDRTDQVVFETPELDSALVLLGPVDAVLYAQTDAVSSDIIVCLQDVYPDGQILNIQEGGKTIFNDASTTPRLQQVNVSVWATGYQLNAGHKLRVVVTSSWFPRYNRNLNTGEPIFSSKEIQTSTQQLFFGKECPSHIILPVLSID